MAEDTNSTNITPDISVLKTDSSSKLLVAIFIVDASRSMDKNGRIGAVNNALRELKYKLSEIQSDNNLDLRVAVMTFTSSARWEIELTPVDELVFNDIKTRPGLTQYGVAFKKLKEVLDRDHFFNYSGKIAPPAIIFLTDGEPDDNYSSDLDELLNNSFFSDASRSAVLIGDAIFNDRSKQAVVRFVDNEQEDIVSAEGSTMILEKIKLATMHNLTGQPITKPDGGNTESDLPPRDYPDVRLEGDICIDDSSVGEDSDKGNPFDDVNGQDNPFDNMNGQNNPFDDVNGQDNPFDNMNGQNNPFDDVNGQDNPFDNVNCQDNPFDNNNI